MADNEEHKDKFVAHYYELAFGLLLKGVRRRIIDASEINNQASVLEVACGTGEQALLYAKEGAAVTALDLSEEMLAVANSKRGRYQLKFLQGDAANLPFDDNQFDLTTITLTLHEINPDMRDKVIEEMKRVTKSDGRIIVADYSISQGRGFLSYLGGLAIFGIEKLVGGDHYKNYREFMKNGDIYALVQKHALKIEKAYGAYGNNLVILSLKKL